VAATLTITGDSLQTTVQDLGRGGYLGDGIPPSGAFDSLSLRLANLLVGNDAGDLPLVGGNPGAAGLEALLGSVSLTVSEERIVAVAGAEADVTVDDEPRPMWESLLLPAEATFRVGRPSSAARVYVALSGGIDVPEVLGSRATNPRARLGGFQGRPLRRGDSVALFPSRDPPAEFVVREVRKESVPQLRPPWELGVVLGPQAHLFADESVELFLSTEWNLSQLADRMGCRFIGPPLRFKPRPDYLVSQAGSDPSNIVDDVTPLGGIQVPSGLEPIAMGVDFPSIGGYAKIATVISAHLPRLGQMRPGDPVRFRPYEVNEAVEELRFLTEGAAAWVTSRATERT
jgi:antagonist of KipI